MGAPTPSAGPTPLWGKRGGVELLRNRNEKSMEIQNWKVGSCGGGSSGEESLYFTREWSVYNALRCVSRESLEVWISLARLFSSERPQSYSTTRCHPRGGGGWGQGGRRSRSRARPGPIELDRRCDDHDLKRETARDFNRFLLSPSTCQNQACQNAAPRLTRNRIRGDRNSQPQVAEPRATNPPNPADDQPKSHACNRPPGASSSTSLRGPHGMLHAPHESPNHLVAYGILRVPPHSNVPDLT